MVPTPWEWRANPCLPEEEGQDRYQRVTVDNLTTGQTWSFDIANHWPDGQGSGHLEAAHVEARRGDQLRVRYNLRTFGYVALLGSGITVVDLNRFYRLPQLAYRPGGDQCGRRLQVFTGDFLNLDLCGPGLRDGIALTPSLAAHGPTGCKEDGFCRGLGMINVYSPLLHCGMVHTSTQEGSPGGLFPAQSIELSQGDLRDIALANETSWVEHGLRSNEMDGPFTSDRPNLPPAAVSGDLLFLSGGAQGVYVFDVSVLDFHGDEIQTVSSRRARPMGRLLAPGHSTYRLQVDEARGLLLAGGIDEHGAPVIDLWDISGVNAAPGTAYEARPVASLAAPWVTNGLGLDGSGTGLLFTWNGDRGATAVPVEAPNLSFVGLYRPDSEEQPGPPVMAPKLAPTSLFVPLGVPLSASVEQDASSRLQLERVASAAFKLRVALPGSLGSEIRAKVQSLRALPDERFLGREDLGEAAGVPGGRGWPDTEVEVTLRRLGGDGTDPGGRLGTAYNLYESDETILLVADPRAQRSYQRQGDASQSPVGDRPTEEDQCPRCSWPSYLPDPETAAPAELAEVKELLASGRWVRAYLELEDGSPLAAFFAAHSSSYPAPAAWVEVSGWADEIPSPSQTSLAEPVQYPAMWSPGEAGLSVSLASGEALLEATDHTTQGRGQAFLFERSYRSGAMGYGPLGSAGWSGSLFAHLRVNRSTGEVDYHDGRGEVFRFLLPVPPHSDSCAPGYEKDSYESYCAATGLDLRLETLAEGGWRLMGSQHEVLVFDSNGRLVELRDRLRRAATDPQTQGSTLKLAYDLFGQLVTVTDDLGRGYQLEYDRSPDSPTYGLLTRLRDFANRAVRFEYWQAFAGDRRLRKVVLPSVSNLGDYASDFSHTEPFMEYLYTDQVFDEHAPVHGDLSPLRLHAVRLPQFLQGEQAPRLERIRRSAGPTPRASRGTEPSGRPGPSTGRLRRTATASRRRC